MNFLSAIGFLTTLPVPNKAFREDGRQILYFPLVGLIIGVLLYAVDSIAAMILPHPLRAAVDVAFLTLISGGLHLDGLADCADGLFSHRDRERSLEIMKDSRIGVMGALALILCLLLKYASLISICGSAAAVWLIAAPAFARASLSVGLVTMSHARAEKGLGNYLYQKGNYALLALCPLALVIPFADGIVEACVAIGGAILITSVTLGWFKSRLGGVTGDALGALSEILETFILVAGGAFCACQNIQ
ncbi:MAG: adenosylcobinamide-GDP ribazoletransferase [Candidatus Nitrohelix vancouverensis]|uniref:Adenosylcobinamide-GDP ribazoletransferase n=1 Tax=Candidatus Nitrohelix vancouverensis TaxID=2705534 RepID=A0A7T0C336_9BACT|nr:MAG: adenosylcobinamide-GDP ribazoletransferase [Candidatus Nitrohelix vancouverensis]